METKREIEEAWTRLQESINLHDGLQAAARNFALVSTPLLVIYAPPWFKPIGAVLGVVLGLCAGYLRSANSVIHEIDEEALRRRYLDRIREDELVPLNHILYRLYDKDGELLYVGITSDVVSRMAGHRADKFWWEEVAEKRFEYMESRAELEAAERIAIIRERPLYNITYNPDRPTTTPRVKPRRPVRW